MASTKTSKNKDAVDGAVAPPPRSSSSSSRPRIFNLMATHPFLFLVVYPVACIVLMVIGFTRDGIIEDEVSNIWIPTEGTFAKDLDYAEGLGAAESLGTASFAAMAIARDGGNLFRADRLAEIRARMEVTERTTVRVGTGCCCC
jgi:hypothetical protein